MKRKTSSQIIFDFNDVAIYDELLESIFFKDVEITENPLICDACQKSLVHYHTLTTLFSEPDQKNQNDIGDDDKGELSHHVLTC